MFSEGVPELNWPNVPQPEPCLTTKIHNKLYAKPGLTTEHDMCLRLTLPNNRLNSTIPQGI